MKNCLECFFVRIIDHEILYTREEVDISNTSKDPDEIVLEFTGNLFKECVIHSTSWRYEKNGLDRKPTIYITYLIYSDKIPSNKGFKKIALKDLKLAVSESAQKPRPVEVSYQNVLAHALRHLAFLVNRETLQNKNKYRAPLNIATISKLNRLYEELAGEI